LFFLFLHLIVTTTIYLLRVRTLCSHLPIFLTYSFFKIYNHKTHRTDDEQITKDEDEDYFLRKTDDEKITKDEDEDYSLSRTNDEKSTKDEDKDYSLSTTDDEEITKDEDEDYSWSRTKLAEDRGNFPPPISSLNGLGQPKFIFVPIRENGRMQLKKIRIRRPKILHATREDGRLRLFLVRDDNAEDDIEEMEEEEKQELVDDDDDGVKEAKEEQFIVESIKEYEEGKEEVQETSIYDPKDICIEGLQLPSHSFMKYYEILNHFEHHHNAFGSHHHLPMYGLCNA
ncbi:uncharacterized protein LOC114192574, partial [Vigna unguiculata]|uniref:uncharacterized protein LOC114192574 n=1 Tax=Vigna unguiculata TaxID=3917 RepID=UPI0010169857